jgi:hypothetical protein
MMMKKKKITCGSYFFICFSQVSRYMGWIVGYLCQLAESLKAKKKSLAADSSALNDGVYKRLFRFVWLDNILDDV